jgi:hypothetical protein
MQKAVSLLKNTIGLNNKQSATKLIYNPESGICELVTAYNVDIEDTGSVSRRKGFGVTAVTDSVHSLFYEKSDCLFVSGTTLYRLNFDYSKTSVKTGLTSGLRVWYTQANNCVYYCNGVEKGYVKDGIWYNWAGSAYTGPITTRRFSDPPVGTVLGFHNGRVYVGVDKNIWFSEYLAYAWFDMARNFIMMEGNIRVIKGVTEGIYVSDEFSTYFFQGGDPSNFRLKLVDTKPIIKGTDCYVDVSKFKEINRKGIGVIWASSTSICLGLEDGTVMDLTGDRLVYPSSNYGCGAVINNNYICFLEE